MHTQLAHQPVHVSNMPRVLWLKHTRQLWFSVHWRKKERCTIQFPYMDLISNKRFKVINIGHTKTDLICLYLLIPAEVDLINMSGISSISWLSVKTVWCTEVRPTFWKPFLHLDYGGAFYELRGGHFQVDNLPGSYFELKKSVYSVIDRLQWTLFLVFFFTCSSAIFLMDIS